MSTNWNLDRWRFISGWRTFFASQMFSATSPAGGAHLICANWPPLFSTATCFPASNFLHSRPVWKDNFQRRTIVRHLTQADNRLSQEPINKLYLQVWSIVDKIASSSDHPEIAAWRKQIINYLRNLSTNCTYESGSSESCHTAIVDRRR